MEEVRLYNDGINMQKCKFMHSDYKHPTDRESDDFK
jgi:hypothetical protein